ncbi:MAG: hypothetical protein ACREOW_14785 [Thermodesulfobacteriota bacterium]
MNSNMSNKLKADFTINIEQVVERVKSYPYISKVINSQLEKLSQFKEPPLIEQTHKVLYWLHRYSETSRLLLNELDQILRGVEDYEFNGKENLLNNFGMAKDDSNFNSAYSELFLANFFIKNNIKLVQYEPLAKDGKYKSDFKICFGIDNNVMVELITPGEKSNDFAMEADFLFEKLERVKSGLSIEISGFESYDSSDLWRTRVEPPIRKQIEEIITNFGKYTYNISDQELPKELPTLCQDYPRIKIVVHHRIPNYEGTVVALCSSRSGEGFPVNRIIKLILDERKHLSPDDFNLVFVDFSNWSRIDRWFLDSPVHRRIIFEELEKRMSSRIDGILTYILSNEKDERLINRRIIWLNSNKQWLDEGEVQRFLKSWESGN